MADTPYSPIILELAEKWVQGTISEPEKQQFIEWYQQFDDGSLVLPAGMEGAVHIMREEGLRQLRERIAAECAETGGGRQGWPARRPGLLVMLLRSRAGRVAVAAVFVGLLGTGVWRMAERSGKPASFSIAAKKVPMAAEPDVMPGSNKAVLTLGSGATVMLDSAHDGKLAQEGNTRIVKSADGQLKYIPVAGAATAAISYNLLSTPRGGQYKLILPDGSKVWLNAASSIRYPTAFTGAERMVEVSGEAYFEVAKNAAMPFRVRVSRAAAAGAAAMDIEVLGTAFDVHAYEADAPINTTLVEGAVRLRKGGAEGVLKPAMQGQLGVNGSFAWVEHADVEKVMAWKNGMFEFRDERLPAILREVCRWYDVDVSYKGAVPDDIFTGQVSRNTTLSGVMKILNLSGVRLTLEGKTIVVH